jgi:Zn-dependent protease with chaperone function
MDFFERQDRARRKTKWLVFYFALAVVGIVLAVYLALWLVFAGLGENRYVTRGAPPLWQPQLFLIAALGTVSVVTLGSLFKMSELSAGGRVVAETLGGRPVLPNTRDPEERRLLNVVEEMAIASGLPVPAVYVLDEERGINAFAAGLTTNDAVVAVTRGCLKTLNRDELQGVIGHEFSHILNGDMRLNVRLIGIIFGILCLTSIGRVLLRTRGRRNPLPLLGLLLILIGAIGVFFGRLIQAAVSRQREFLADAASVQFTRNPAGLSGALQKIAVLGSRLRSEHAADACHMFFANGLRQAFVSLFATHPPIEERIRAIDPTWDGTFKAPRTGPEQQAFLEALTETESAPARAPETSSLARGGRVVVRAQTVMPLIGQPAPVHLRYAEDLRAAIPENVRLAAREPTGAQALVFALLLSPDTALRARQLALLENRLGAPMRERVAALHGEVVPLAVRARLPLVNLALPALRQLRSDEFERFRQTLQALIESDAEINLFEFTLLKIIERQLEPRFGGARPKVVQYYSMKPLVADAAVLLSALANVSSADPAAVARAFASGAPYLRAGDVEVELLPLEQCGLEAIRAALDRLAQAAPQIKRNVLEACVRVVGADGVIQEPEAELLRAIAETLDCPLPPFVTVE